MEEFRSLGEMHEEITLQEDRGEYIPRAVLFGPSIKPTSY